VNYKSSVVLCELLQAMVSMTVPAHTLASYVSDIFFTFLGLYFPCLY